MTKNLSKIGVACLYGLMSAVGLNWFLISANTYSSGITGVAQLINKLTVNLDINLTVSLIVLLLNLPLIMIAWFKIGKIYTLYSLVSVLTSSLFLAILPVQVIVNDRLVEAVFGGALMGAGVGFCFKAGFSTGGVDIIATLIRKATGAKVGQVSNVINAAIVLTAGFLFGWPSAIYSLIAIFVNGLMIDYFYTQQQRVTVTIFSKNSAVLKETLKKDFWHGATVLDNGRGLYTDEEVTVIMTVVSKYELTGLKQMISQADSQAFVNIQPTYSLLGRFIMPEN